jgi:hypothetical protein
VWKTAFPAPAAALAAAAREAAHRVLPPGLELISAQKEHRLVILVSGRPSGRVTKAASPKAWLTLFWSFCRRFRSWRCGIPVLPPGGNLNAGPRQSFRPVQPAGRINDYLFPTKMGCFRGNIFLRRRREILLQKKNFFVRLGGLFKKLAVLFFRQEKTESSSKYVS